MAISAAENPDLTTHPIGILALAIFVIAYLLVVVEETIHLRKSKPVLVAAGVIWALIGIAYSKLGRSQQAYEAAAHTIFEYGELFLFLLVAITYVNTLEEQGCSRLCGRGLLVSNSTTEAFFGLPALPPSFCRRYWTI